MQAVRTEYQSILDAGLANPDGHPYRSVMNIPIRLFKIALALKPGAVTSQMMMYMTSRYAFSNFNYAYSFRENNEPTIFELGMKCKCLI